MKLSKYTTVTCLAVLLVSLGVNAQGPPVGYIGLFTDDMRSSWCAQGEGFYPVEMWIWCLPGALGMICYEMGLNFPSNVIESTATSNDALSPCVGCTRWSLCFMMCQLDWVWIWHQTLWVTDSEPSIVEITGHPQSGMHRFYNCEPGYPAEPCIIYTSLFINYDPSDPECMATSSEKRSWGAIKSIIVE